MSGSKVLVLGGTGPAGICLLRELIYRNHAAVVYARNPNKIPAELASNPLLEIVKGEISDSEALSNCISQCSAVISLLGPNIKDRNIEPTFFADYYTSTLFPAMRKHGVRRLLAMGTLSIMRPEDHFSFFHLIVVVFMRLLASSIYKNMQNLADAFSNKAQGIDWTVFRLTEIPGESDEASWQKDREDGELFTGWIGEKGWTRSMNRSAVARWLVDALEGGADAWVGKMPAVSRLAGSKSHAS
ncbi:NAD(P)-binding protein [Thozetella sp. PMI_491]|nr:NAD(P)-binding protein [Thozetella sp. PMI_491]